MEPKDKFDDAPTCLSYHTLWADRFDIEIQRNILLHFIVEKNLDADFVAYLKHHFPENEQ